MTKLPYDIHKAAAIIIQDRKVLLTRSKGKDVFVSPGGKLEAGETSVQACIRELKEEISIDVAEADLAYVGTYFAEAAGGSGKSLRMDVYTVLKYTGIVRADNEIEEIIYVGADIPDDMEVGSIFLHEIIPYLTSHDLID
jgi:8-oxo-dGTP diphosphatase